MKSSQGMIKSCVSRSWVYKVRKGQLVEIPQPLEQFGVYQIALMGFTIDESVDGVANLKRVQHGT